MSAPAAGLHEVLAVARDNGSVSDGIARVSGAAVIEAAGLGLVIVHNGDFNATWAVRYAARWQQDIMRLNLTDAGRAYLAEVTA